MEEQGCQLLLQKLQERKLEDIQMIFSEVKDHICKLMFNRFGSDVILKLFEVCDEEQKNQLVSSVTVDARLLIHVCLDPRGSETMQKFIGFPMEQEQIYRIMRCFSYFAVPLANHPIGYQVLGQCFKIFPVPAKETQPILDTITEFCLELAVDENGSNLLKILLSEHWSGVLSIVGTILTDNEIFSLAGDEFGSSLIQHLIGLLKHKRLRDLVDQMEPLLVPLSYDKYGTEVVKKLIGASRGKYAPQIISVMINDPGLLDVISYPWCYSLLKYAQTYAKGTDRKNLDDLIHRYSQPL
ncbi:pumilio homolog 12-like [Primulina tabacum]|uniref:pumilio homolog 12-like n=1 Tax=Primulina tabacum TaxID=48773 RepID=UPI003F5ACE2A